MEEICDDFKSKRKPEPGALLPAEHGAILKDPGVYKREAVPQIDGWDRGRDADSCRYGIEEGVDYQIEKIP